MWLEGSRLEQTDEGGKEDPPPGAALGLGVGARTPLHSLSPVSLRKRSPASAGLAPKMLRAPDSWGSLHKARAAGRNGQDLLVTNRGPREARAGDRVPANSKAAAPSKGKGSVLAAASWLETARVSQSRY